MNPLVFLLEEPSAEAMLEGLLPRIVPPGTSWRFIVFEGKQDLERQMVRRLRGYREPNARFVVLRDKDAGDCHRTKRELTDKCAEAGKPHALVRIACHELESWFLADLAAVEVGLRIPGLATHQNKRQYRSPDALPSPSRTLLRLAPAYQKVSGASAIGSHLNPDNRRSRSFAVFVDGLRRLLSL